MVRLVIKLRGTVIGHATPEVNRAGCVLGFDVTLTEAGLAARGTRGRMTRFVDRWQVPVRVHNGDYAEVAPDGVQRLYPRPGTNNPSGSRLNAEMQARVDARHARLVAKVMP